MEEETEFEKTEKGKFKFPIWFQAGWEGQLPKVIIPEK